MIAFTESKFWQYPVEYIEKYCLFDEYGSICGTKEDAPPEFKEAYEADKKMYDDALKRGILL